MTDAVRTLANIIDRFVPGEVYNIGSEEAISMEELAEVIMHATGCDKGLFEYTDEEPWTTHHKRVDCSKARRDLAHTPVMKLQEGVRCTAEWMTSLQSVRPFTPPGRDGAKLEKVGAEMANLSRKSPE